MDTKRILSGALLALLIALTTAACVGLPGSDPGSRTFGTLIDDKQLERRAKRELRAAHEDLANAHLVVRSFEGRVLIAGEVPSAEVRELAERTVSSLRKVRTVYNELRVSGPTTFLSRRNDGWISDKVNAKMLAASDFDSDHVKVVTVNGTVYLLGRVARAEGAQAAQIAQSVYGVERVVKLLEYMD